MTDTCKHRMAVAELQWDALLLRCVWCPFEEIRNRCIGILADRSRCPIPADEDGYSTCERHGDQEPPKWGPA